MKSKTILTTIIAILFIAVLVTAEIPRVINYQGNLTESDGTPSDGVFFIRFVIYDAATGGTEVWNSGIQQVTVTNGLFEVMLGASPTPPLPNNLFSTDTSRYLSITVEADPEISPRIKFTSMAFAYQSLHSDSAGYAANADIANVAGFAESIAANAVGTNEIIDGSVTGADIDNTSVQLRVTGTAPLGSYITGINEDGSVVTALDNAGTGDITAVYPGNGLSGGGESGAVTLSVTIGGITSDHIADNAIGTLDIAVDAVTTSEIADGSITGVDIDNTSVQQRVTGVAPSGNYITAINADGSVITALDQVGIGDITGVSAGSGLDGGGTSGDITLFIPTSGITSSHIIPDAVTADKIADGSVQFSDISQNGAVNGQVMKWNGTTWAAADDQTGSAGWNWSDSSSFGPDSVLFADSANHADVSNNAIYSDSTDAITDGAVDFVDIGQNSAASGQVMKWNGSAWAVANDETGTGADTDWTISGNDMYSGVSGNVGIGTPTPTEKLDVSGNIVVGGKANIGPSNTNTGTYSFVAGQNNSASGHWSTVSGGVDNSASQDHATVSGGLYDTASGQYATVGGGTNNTASGQYATVGGGQSNLATNQYAAVSGGSNNTASSWATTVSGGQDNTASGMRATVGGGILNTASGGATTVGGGDNNTASSTQTTVSGGSFNTASNFYATVGGGFSNVASGKSSTVGGGEKDTAMAPYSGVSAGLNNTAGDEALDTAAYVGGGQDNSATSKWSTVSGGKSNSVSQNYATVSGGLNDTASGLYATVSGGSNNIANNPGATVGGGNSNTAGYWYATVGGGEYNLADGDHAVISGGENNTASGDDAAISGGVDNTASGFGSFVGSGEFNDASGDYSTISGGKDNIASNTYATVGGGRNDTASGQYAAVGGGYLNGAGGDKSTVSGGFANKATGAQSTVGGGYLNIASGNYATVAGGFNCAAKGIYSFATGYNAKANWSGSIVLAANYSVSWADSVRSGGNGQMVLCGTGGLYITDTVGLAPYIISRLINTSSGAYLSSSGIWTNASDRNIKENFSEVDGNELLDKIASLEISEWNYKEDDESVKHIGPVAQDFYEVFGLGDDDKTISTIDPAGIALAGVKELISIIDELKQQNAVLAEEIAELKAENK